MCTKENIKLDNVNVKEKIGQTVCHETCQDIEDFLFPKFDIRTQLPQSRRKWRIVQDGHGRWREIYIDGKDEISIKGKCEIAHTDKSLPKQVNLTRGNSGNKLLFSNHILNSARSSAKPQTGRPLSSDFNYKALSTNTRANIFPGVGKHKWYSQSNHVYSESALKLGSQSCGRNLQDEFHGITRDALGSWNEASIHHERMKKSWHVYLESLTKTGGVKEARPMKKSNRNTEVKVQEIINQKKKIKKIKKLVSKKTQEETEQNEVNELKVNDELIPPQLQQTVDKDDDFWDFYEQPFVQS